MSEELIGKECIDCHQLKPADCFYHHNTNKDGLSGYCKQCEKKRASDWRSKNPNYKKRAAKTDAEWTKNNKWRIRSKVVTRQYGLSPEDLKNLFDIQNGCCAICEKQFDKLPNTGTSPNIDHCHETNRVRGILCMNCNNALGKFEDNEQGILKALRYLRRPRITTKHPPHPRKQTRIRRASAET
jgi:hypothetical protein